MNDKKEPKPSQELETGSVDNDSASVNQPKAVEVGGYKGPEPTRYGDWEQKGRCTDF